MTIITLPIHLSVTPPSSATTCSLKIEAESSQINSATIYLMTEHHFALSPIQKWPYVSITFPPTCSLHHQIHETQVTPL